MCMLSLSQCRYLSFLLRFFFPQKFYFFLESFNVSFIKAGGDLLYHVHQPWVPNDILYTMHYVLNHPVYGL